MIWTIAMAYQVLLKRETALRDGVTVNIPAEAWLDITLEQVEPAGSTFAGRPAPFSGPRSDARADPPGDGADAGPLPALATPALS
jgi:hypothetical protein